MGVCAECGIALTRFKVREGEYVEQINAKAFGITIPEHVLSAGVKL